MTSDLNNLTFLTHLPLRARRHALRTAWHAMRMAGRVESIGVDTVLTFAIRASRAEATRLEGEILFHDLMTTLEWGAILARSKDDLIRDMRAISFAAPDALTQFARTTKPLIFAPLHMGCFALPLAKLMQDHFADRPMLILRAREDRPEETQAMERIAEIGVDMRFMNVAKKNTYLDAIRFARKGAIIVSFIDLPGSYGSPVPVNFFGRPAHFAMGLNALARVTGASVVPMSVISTLKGDSVDFGTPFESYRNGSGEKARVAEIVRRYIEQAILKAPDQWHMWPRLNEYLQYELHSEAA